jgi:hypothetical protein
MGLESGTGRVLSFADIYKHIQTLRESMAAFRAFNARKRHCQENAAELDAVNSSAEAVESAAAPLLNLAIDLRCSQCRAKRSNCAPSAGCSVLARHYLQYKIIEALQPHSSYKFDDGFQPLGLISTLRFDGEPGAEEALAEFCGRQPPIMSIVAEFIEKGIIVQTPYEPWNGDVMLGLRDYLPRREAAREERKRLIEELAAKYDHRAGWNEDGSGWLVPSSRGCGGIFGSVWDLLSYLRGLEQSVTKRRRTLN